MDILNRFGCPLSVLLILSAVLFTQCGERTGDSIPGEGFIAYEIDFIAHGDSDGFQQTEPLRKMMDGGVVEWYFSPGKEWVVQKYELMGHALVLSERYDLRKQQKTTFVDYLGQRKESHMDKPDWQFTVESASHKAGYILLNEYSEFEGIQTQKFEGFIDMEGYRAHLNGYVAVDLPMKASVIQGLEFNFLPGALVKAEVTAESLWTIHYQAAKLSTEGFSNPAGF